MVDNIEKIITDIKLDRSAWRLVTFGDVAVQQKQTVDRENTHLTRYIKGEHMSSEDLHIREWGELTDEYLGPAFIRKFRKGDILYGSRRTYLRKVAIADFDGITSNTTFVINANENKIDKRLLPFIMLSEGFTEHSIKNSKGSVNPYVNWKDLADYEFLLPPPEEQQKLAELLWAMDEVIEREKKVLDNLKVLLESEIEEQLHGIPLYGKNINFAINELINRKSAVKLKSLGEFLKGKGIAKSDVIEEGIPCVRYGELYTKHHRIIRKYHSFISEEVAVAGLRLKKGDVLIAGSGETISEIGKSAAFISDDEVYAGSDTLIFRPYEMNGIYLGYLMNSQFVRQQLNKFGTGATVMHIYTSDLKKIIVPAHNLSQQKSIAEKLELISQSIQGLKNKIDSSQALQKSIINQIF